MEGRPAALLLFGVGKHEASVFVTERAAGGVGLPGRERSGFAVRSVEIAELQLTGVSDVNPAELEKLMAVLARVQ